ncbi:hypothetical protein MMC30_002722 [Trapelia coarctata]|nr:hypothetical protein [Trapelia coarctata]
MPARMSRNHTLEAATPAPSVNLTQIATLNSAQLETLAKYITSIPLPTYPPPAPKTKIAATARNATTMLQLSLRLIITLFLLLFLVLLPSFALMVATAGVCAYMFGHAAWWEAVVTLVLAVDLAFVPGVAWYFAFVLACLLADELRGLNLVEWPCGNGRSSSPRRD